MNSLNYSPFCRDKLADGMHNENFKKKQECIQVGCVPSAAVAVSRGGGCLLRGGVCSGGVSAPGGLGVYSGAVCFGGGCLLPGVCSWGGVCSQGVCLGVSALGVSAVRVSSPRVCVLWGGVCSWGVSAPGVSAPRGVSHYALRQTPPPSCGQTDACKNITFTTLLRTVIIYLNHFLF